MDEQKQQLIDRIKQAQNILVSVSSNPSVDQLAAAIGLTVALNKLGKHGTAVFSGEVPSTIEFLKPEETLEKNTDSLRDFIIALDKTKADKLRYKVEDDVVRIFITPYKTSITDKDLEFSQGDFNVDVVIALGVTDPADLDKAITAHGRILHDASVASISTVGQGSLGSINWVDPTASSLSEMMLGLSDGLDKKLIDGQIATALLTGIVASTERFSNDKTSPKTMSASAELMAAGANQQLIATQLESPATVPASDSPADSETQPEPSEAPIEKPVAASDKPKKDKPEPGTLEIDHEAPQEEQAEVSEPEPLNSQIQVDDEGQIITEDHDAFPAISQVRGGGTDPTPATPTPAPVDEPAKGNDLTANSKPEPAEKSAEELTLPVVDSPLLSHTESVLPSSPQPATPPVAPAPFTPPPSWSAPAAVAPSATLNDIEQAVGSPHVQPNETSVEPTPEATVDDARSAVEAAYSSASAPSDPLQPIAALNAQPLGPELRQEPPVPAPALEPAPAPANAYPNMGFSEPTPGNTPADDALDMPLPSNPFGPGQQLPQNPLTMSMPPAPQAPASTFPGAPQPSQAGQTPPPPVPPPMLPPLQ